ncbi:MAG: hypothetical protein B7X32_04900 [Microbacterium sp. 13-71-7]|nr:MAG: hypothetical protein B7X32_04900 [Microbacterium sp. 13-71-7]
MENVIYADSIAELVDVLLPGHAEADAASQLVSRVEMLEVIASQRQALILADEGIDGFNEDELNIMLATKGEPLDIDAWNPATPLLVLATNYAPYTDVSLPAGTVICLDPRTELTFIAALQALGTGELFVSA